MSSDLASSVSSVRSNLKNALQNESVRTSGFSSQLLLLSRKRADLSDRIATLEAEKTGFQNEITRLTTESKRFQQSQSGLNDRLQQTEKAIAEAKAVADTAQQSKSTCISDLAHVNTLLAELGSRNDISAKDNLAVRQSLNAKLEELKSKMNSQTEEIAKARDVVRALETERNQLRVRLQDVLLQQEKVQTDVKNAQEMLTKLDTVVKRWATTLEQYKVIEDLPEYSSAIQKLQSELS